MKYLIPILLLFSACSTCERVIGAGFDTRTNIVDCIYIGSPAEKMGIKLGDKLLSTNEFIVVLRNNEMLVFKKETVCLDTLREWK